MNRSSFYKQFAGTIAITALSGLLFACASATDVSETSYDTAGNTESTVSTRETSSDNIILVTEKDTDPTYEEDGTVR